MSYGIWLLKKLKKHKTVACDYRVITAREIPNGILLQQYCIVSFTNSKKKDWFHSHFNCVGEFLHCGNFVSRSQRGGGGLFQFSFGFENTRFRNIIRPATAKVEIWKGWCTADTDSKVFVLSISAVRTCTNRFTVRFVSLHCLRSTLRLQRKPMGLAYAC